MSCLKSDLTSLNVSSSNIPDEMNSSCHMIVKASQALGFADGAHESVM